MHRWRAQSSLQQNVDPVYPITSHTCSSSCRFDDPHSQCGTPVPNWGVPAMGDVQRGTEYNWKYPWSIMFQRYVGHLQSNYHRQVWNRVQSGVFTGHLLIGMIPFCSCPVYAWNVDLSMFSFTGYTIESAESRVWTNKDGMDSIVLSTFDASCTMQLLCHMLPPPHCPLQLPAYELFFCWVRGTGEIRLLRVYRFFVESIFSW